MPTAPRSSSIPTVMNHPEDWNLGTPDNARGTEVIVNPYGNDSSGSYQPPQSSGSAASDLHQEYANHPAKVNPYPSSFSTEIDGKEVLLPVLRPDGTTMSEDDAVNQYIETGKALGHFGSPEEADQFAESRAPRQKVTLPAIDFSL
jgi:hypothetical protein